VVGSHYLQDKLDARNIEDLNKYLAETEKINEIELDPATINYKEQILETFKEI
jgi:hypothetical protein